MADRKAYAGSHRKLVLAFDIGTTYSGVSFSILDPGQVPQIKTVTRFPAHEQINGASKIPTIIYYDQAGKVRAVGAEATREGIYEIAEDEKWVKTEWFKLHLRSKFGDSLTEKREIPPLPLNKNVVDIFADFLQYLFQCSSDYLQDTYANGEALWASVKDHIHFVLSHPNGWEGMEQTQMRYAAVKAGLIPDTVEGRGRLSFVTEGEASLHFAINNRALSGTLKDGESVVIVDAGGGTIDVSSYKRKGSKATGTSLRNHTYGEIAIPQCHFHGSVFVTTRAKLFLEALLSQSKFLEDLSDISDCFDKTTKLRFSKAEGPQYIKFGSTRDNDPSINIRIGQLKLEGSDVAKFFQPPIDCIIEAVLNQKANAKGKNWHVVLVGGFAANDWLFSRVQSALKAHGFDVHRPENYTNKAVSDGAISFFIDHFVSARVSRFVYGITTRQMYNVYDPEHRKRSGKIFLDASGVQKLDEHFSVILAKNAQVSENQEFRRPDLQMTSPTKSEASSLTVTLWAYRGDIAETPRWIDEDRDNFTKLCRVDADVSHLPMSAKRNDNGKIYYQSPPFSIVLLFGFTEIQAQIAWRENGVEKRSPAVIVYEPEE